MTEDNYTILGTVKRPPMRRLNAASRAREHLVPEEVDRLITAAKNRGRHGERDALAISMAYRHGLRVSELCALRWEQIDFYAKTLFVNRLKGGIPSTQPLGRDAIAALKRLDRTGTFIFVNERRRPMTPTGFARMLKRTAASIGFEIDVHPHMLRHACGYKLANDGRDTRSIQGYLGHKNIQHTVRYTAIANNRFEGFWED